MKNFFYTTATLFLALTLFTSCSKDEDDDTDTDVVSDNLWQGEMITFAKEDNADWTLAAQQDRITDNVWITRQNTSGIFNIAVETSNTDACSSAAPADTEWAYGSTEDISSLTFQSLGSLIGCNFQNIVDDQNMVLHLITDDIYIDLKFISWSSGSGGGGGFSYERSTKD